MKLNFFLIVLSIIPSLAQSVELNMLSVIRQNLAANQNDALVQSTNKLYSAIAKHIPKNIVPSLTASALENFKKSPPEKTLLNWIDQLDAALCANDLPLSFQHALTIQQLAGKKRFDETDHEKVYRQALFEAQNKPTHMSLSWLQVTALPVKQYNIILEAGEKIWLLRDSDEAAKFIAEPLHKSQQRAAIAALELGQVDRASALLLRSLEAPGRIWSTTSPDMLVADRMLRSQHRTAVIAYLEACLKKEWPNRTPYLKQWLDEIKTGKTPQLRFPLEAMAPSALN
jgi:hypothetical protein